MIQTAAMAPAQGAGPTTTPSILDSWVSRTQTALVGFCQGRHPDQSLTALADASHTNADAQAAQGETPCWPVAFKAVPLCGSQDSAYYRTYRWQLRPSSQHGPRRPPWQATEKQHCVGWAGAVEAPAFPLVTSSSWAPASWGCTLTFWKASALTPGGVRTLGRKLLGLGSWTPR